MTLQNRQYYNNIHGLLNERLKTVGNHTQMFKKYKLTTDMIKKGTTVYVPHPDLDDEYVEGVVYTLKDWHSARKQKYVVNVKGEKKPLEVSPNKVFIKK